jgi:hypothetical protein
MNQSMLSTRVFGLVCAVAVFVCLMAATRCAQPRNKRTLVSGPIALPGVTLLAGQYVFRLRALGSRGMTLCRARLRRGGCYPFGLVRPASRRFVARAERVPNAGESLLADAAEGGGKR